MRTVFRFLFLIPLGFVAACFAAGFALLWPFLDLPPGSLEDPFVIAELAVGYMTQCAQVGSVALVPWGLFMVASEIVGWRSLLLHAALGALGGVIVGRMTAGAPNSVETALAVAGLAFGLVYWLVAGNGAGRWRRRAVLRNDVAPT
ncbi:hypothetical protein [Aureimonas jatrophae]|uniref:Uncharacterized protein n=1 Tax=Aureimonas jatrophae TaxID=1166073 RepID=A0A1H0BWD0_9HYPH|nr:hypothetical protein [Aureimonas jatrophae]MBB3948963.1 hypothetical protein [Aureimonas jatrophae]SDN49979.1 hypothetical protein SAMN05192530_10133 [Aureimonas jatrophae]